MIRFSTFVPLASASLALVGSALAQGTAAPAVALDALEVAVQDQGTPQFSVGNVNDKPSDPENWIELEATFQLKGAEAWEDSVTVRWYIGMLDQANQPIILPLEVTYNDVPVGEEVRAAVYVAPRSIARITGKDRVMVSQVTAHGAELRAGSEVLGAVDQSKQYGPAEVAQAWFNSNAEFDRRDGVLRPRSDTPFAPLWSDYYLEERSKP